jgi:uncharacterized membrane-anchored protein YhcB (DUF1043 family)
MFGEISLMAWMGSVIVFAIGGGAGFFIARQIKDKRTLQLEQQLQATQSKLTEYQDEVNRHFLKSSLLFNKLTDNYREVYEHLATGAQKLCNEKPIPSALNLPDTKILSAAIAANPSAAAVNEEKSQTSVTAPEFAETAHRDPDHMSSEATGELTEHLGVESIIDHQTLFERHTETTATENVNDDTATSQQASAKHTEQTDQPLDNDTPIITKAELKTLEASERAKKEEEDIELGAESTPSVEVEFHKTHPAIH